MIEDIREGKPVSIVDYQRFAEGDVDFMFQANEAKKEWKHTQPKIYRNGTGKRYYASKNNKVKDEYLVETEIQGEAELDQELSE